jgi:hypothetical protein
MRVDIQDVIEELEQGQRSQAGARECPEAVQRLRQTVDRTRRVLNNLPPLQGRGDSARQSIGRLMGAIEMAEGSLHGQDPAA